MKIVKTTATPKKAVSKIEINDTENTPVSEIMEWANGNILGTLWWTKTQFRDPKTGSSHASVRKKHFTDGYYVYTFWFSRKADAAKFILFWGYR